MKYSVFRNVVLETLKEERGWAVEEDWTEGTSGSGARPVNEFGGDDAGDFIEMEREKGAIYEFMSISVGKLFTFYRDEGWDAVVRELESHTRTGKAAEGRNRGIDYAARLNEDGRELYDHLRKVRAEIALQKQLPSYIVFPNRTLFEMCSRKPETMEQLRTLYGVGEKKSKEYGSRFLEEILAFTGEGKSPALASLP